MMHCHKSQISRIRNGKTTPSLGNEEIFTKVFDLNNPESAARSGEKNRYYLGLLKDEIESNFNGIFETMADCWEEKEYKTFVLTLLGRARQGAHSKEQKGMSLDETPSEQMSNIFEQAVADYNIATCICKLPDYLLGEPFYAGDIYNFIDVIQTDILGKFVNQQDENIFLKISEFALAVKTYSSFLVMIRLSVSEKYGSLLKLAGLNYEIIELIDDDKNEIKNKCGEKIPTEESVNKPSVSELEERLTQLDFIRSILLSHKRLCELFEDICPGKTILAFQ